MRIAGLSALLASAACAAPAPLAEDAAARGDAARAADAAPEDADAGSSSPDAAVRPRRLASWPTEGAARVPRSAWIELVFDAPVAPSALALDCGGAVALRPTALAPERVLLDPSPELPASARCALTLDGEEVLRFEVAGRGEPARVFYDRSDGRRLAPLPDDVFLVEGRLAIPLPELPLRERALYAALLEGTPALDGFSPVAPIVVELSDTASAASFPRTVEASLEPTASVALIALDDAARVPFRAELRDEVSVTQVVSRTLLVFPGVALEPRRSYALVVTRRALASPERPFEADAPLALALSPPVAGEPEAVRRLREVIEPAARTISSRAFPPIAREDLALVLRFTVRSLDGVPDDPIAMRAQLDALPPMVVSSTEAEVNESPVELVVRGEFSSPRWRDGEHLARDATGALAVTPTVARPFVLALPRSPRPAPLVMFQHGNPGDAESVIHVARSSLAAAGFAVIGFTDVLNREVAPNARDPVDAGRQQILATLEVLLRDRRLPDYWLDTTGEQLALIRSLPSLAREPRLAGRLDLAAPLSYAGVSEGAVRGSALLAYAPEIRAAALTVGGARLVETLIHQAGPRFVEELGALLPELTPAEIWAGLSLFQLIYDAQDAHVHARFYARQRVAPTATRRASVLVTMGLEDGFIPNSATESLAAQLMVPQLLPAAQRVPFLDAIEGPVRANLPDGETGAYFQFVPSEVEGSAPTPGCETQPQGHYCPQETPLAVAQRLRFLRGALIGAPEIAAP